MRKILKWSVPVDDSSHSIGSGDVVHVGSQVNPLSVEVWTDERDVDNIGERFVRVVGTGHPVSDGAKVLGSTVVNPFVWHVVEDPR